MCMTLSLASALSMITSSNPSSSSISKLTSSLIFFLGTPSNLVENYTYLADGIQSTLTLPSTSGEGHRIQLISTTTDTIRVYPTSGGSINGVINGYFHINHINN